MQNKERNGQQFIAWKLQPAFINTRKKMWHFALIYFANLSLAVFFQV